MPKFVMIVGSERLELDNDRMKLSEADKCERFTGWTTSEWWDAFVKGRSQAIRFAYWLAKSRAEQTVDYNGIDFDFADFDFELVDVEPEGEPAGMDEGPTGPALEGEVLPA